MLLSEFNILYFWFGEFVFKSEKVNLLFRNVIGGIILLVMISIVFVVPFADLVTKKEIDNHLIGQVLDTEKGRNALIFFGFEKCGDLCPETMLELKKFSDKHNESDNFPQIVFIDIDKDSNQKNAERYAKMFNEKFVGYFPSNEEFEKLKMFFGLNIQQSGELISHVGRVYLLERIDHRWWIRKAYSPKGISIEKLGVDLKLDGKNHV